MLLVAIRGEHGVAECPAAPGLIDRLVAALGGSSDGSDTEVSQQNLFRASSQPLDISGWDTGIPATDIERLRARAKEILLRHFGIAAIRTAAERSNEAIYQAWRGRALRDTVLTSDGYQQQCLGRVLPDY